MSCANVLIGVETRHNTMRTIHANFDFINLFLLQRYSGLIKWGTTEISNGTRLTRFPKYCLLSSLFRREPALVRRSARVHVDRLSPDDRGLIRCQEGHDAPDFDGLDQSAQLRRRERLDQRVWITAITLRDPDRALKQHGRVHCARANGIDVDLIWRQFQGHRPRQADHGGFGRLVMGLRRTSDLA